MLRKPTATALNHKPAFARHRLVESEGRIFRFLGPAMKTCFRGLRPGRAGRTNLRASQMKFRSISIVDFSAN